MDEYETQARDVILDWANKNCVDVKEVEADELHPDFIAHIAAALRETAKLAAEATEFTGKQELDAAKAEIAKLEVELAEWRNR